MLTGIISMVKCINDGVMRSVLFYVTSLKTFNFFEKKRIETHHEIINFTFIE